MSERTTRIATGTSVLAIQRAINAILGIILLAFMVRILTVAEMGVFGAADIIFKAATVLFGLGLNFAASRFVPYHLGTNQKDTAIFIAKRVLLLAIIPATLFSVITFEIAHLLSLALFVTPTYAGVFHALSIAAWMSIVGLTIIDLLKGFQRFNKLAAFGVISQLLRFALTVGLLYLGIGVVSVFLGWFSFYFLISVLGIPVIFLEIRKRKEEDKVHLDPSLQPVFIFSLFMMGFWFTKLLAESIDHFLVLSLIGLIALGFYTTAVAISMFLEIIGVPILSTLTPSLSNAYGQKGEETVPSIVGKAFRYMALLFSPIPLLISVLSQLIINVIAGPTYFHSVLPLAIICIGLASYGFSLVMISTLTAIGKARSVFISYIAALLIEILTGFLLILYFGIIGAAIARSLMYLILLIQLYWFTKRNFHKLILDKEMLVKIISSFTVAILAISIIVIITGSSTILLGLYVLIFLLVYLLVLLLFKALTVDDLELLMKIIPGGQKISSRLRRRVVNYN